MGWSNILLPSPPPLNTSKIMPPVKIIKNMKRTKLVYRKKKPPEKQNYTLNPLSDAPAGKRGCGKDRPERPGNGCDTRANGTRKITCCWYRRAPQNHVWGNREPLAPPSVAVVCTGGRLRSGDSRGLAARGRSWCAERSGSRYDTLLPPRIKLGQRPALPRPPPGLWRNTVRTIDRTVHTHTVQQWRN